jgi:hypothetical protein
VCKYLNIIALFVFLISFDVQAQMPLMKGDSLPDTIRVSKTEVKAVAQQIADSLKPKVFKPNPMKVVWMGAIIPGYGQILNRRYWKLPIVYAGFMGCAYALAFNSGKYQTYKTAYRDILRYSSDVDYQAIVDKDHSKVSFYQILPPGYTDFTRFGGVTGFTKTLKNKQDSFRRYRDLSIFATVGWYAITIIEAYVDAQLYDFDITPDLSMRVQPALLRNAYGVPSTLGLQCNLSLR